MSEETKIKLFLMVQRLHEQLNTYRENKSNFEELVYSSISFNLIMTDYLRQLNEETVNRLKDIDQKLNGSNNS